MNFPLIMLILLVITGGIALLDRFVLQRHRAPEVRGRGGWNIRKAFFPVILVVFCLRSFLVEPFKIPSGSMIPTLLVGDFILVNKYTYGIRLPVINVKIMDIKEPQRGEVMVFRYPENPSMDYIKRIIGVPGDTVTYRDKRLFINNVPVKMEPDGEYTYVESGLNYIYSRRFSESLGDHSYKILINPEVPDILLAGVRPFPSRKIAATMTADLPARYLPEITSRWATTATAAATAGIGDLFRNATSSARRS